MTGTGKGIEIRPFGTVESALTPSKIHMPKVNMCLRFLDDSIPSEVEEALAGSTKRAFHGSSEL